jgi:hypothetical protein
VSFHGAIVTHQQGDLLAQYGAAPVSARVELVTGALRQLNAAKTGRRLTSYASAEDAYTFLQPAANDAGAWLKGAYWLAVAAQVEGNNALVGEAQRFYERGAAMAYAAGTKDVSGGIRSILLDAAGRLRSYGTGKFSSQAADMLEDRADAAVILAQQERVQTGRGLLDLFGLQPGGEGSTNWVTWAMVGLGGVVLFSTVFSLIRRRE